MSNFKLQRDKAPLPTSMDACNARGVRISNLSEKREQPLFINFRARPDTTDVGHHVKNRVVEFEMKKKTIGKF